jgi:hypothetical protein
MKDACPSQPQLHSVEISRRVCCRRRVKKPEFSFLTSTRRCSGWGVITLSGLMIFLLGSLLVCAQTSMSEYQVKALFLCNFVKYVTWPTESTGPIVIGILGQDNFNDSLTQAVEGKNFNGRPIVIKHLSGDDDLSSCSILFISASENSRLNEILSKAGKLPVLTVGEDNSFLGKGGIIDFTLKEEKIHLQISLRAAQKVNLQISSKLLSVADVVRE